MQSGVNNQLPIEIGYTELSISNDRVLIDCRPQDKFELSHLDGAINIPLQHLSIRTDDLPCNKDDVVYVYCRTGNRSTTFATYLRSMGFSKCQSITGGYELWGDSDNAP